LEIIILIKVKPSPKYKLRGMVYPIGNPQSEKLKRCNCSRIPYSVFGIRYTHGYISGDYNLCPAIVSSTFAHFTICSSYIFIDKLR